MIGERVFNMCLRTVFSSGFAEAVSSPAPSAANVLSDNISISVVDDNDYGDSYVGSSFPTSCLQSKLPLLQDYEVSTFDDSDQSDLEQEGHDGGNIDIPTEHSRPLSSPATTYRPQRDSMMSFMTSSTRTAVNSTTPYGLGEGTGVSLRQDSVDSLIIVPANVEAESGVVEEVGDSGMERRDENYGRARDSETIEAVPLHAETQDSDGDHDAARTYPSSCGGSPYEKNTFIHSSNESHGSRTPAGAKSSPKRQVSTPTHVDIPIPGPRKTKVIVKECEYATYYAVLYYVSDSDNSSRSWFLSTQPSAAALYRCYSFLPIDFRLSDKNNAQ